MRLLDGNFQGADGFGIFCTAIDITLVGADGISGNRHAFNDGVGVTLQGRGGS